MILGLDAPTSGPVIVNGRLHLEHAAPCARWAPAGRSVGPPWPQRAYHHLLALAQTNGIRRSRVDEVVEAVGGAADGGRRLPAWASASASRPRCSATRPR